MTGGGTIGANLERQLTRIATTQVAYASQNAINQVAYEAWSFVTKKIPQVFDRPTRETRTAVKFTKAVYSKNVTTAAVFVDDFELSDQQVGGRGWSSGKKKLAPSYWFAPHVYGGPRSLKAFERLMQSKNILPAGMFVVPGAGCRLDAFGNIPGSFLNQILAWFQSFGRYAGDMANMGEKRMASLMGKRAAGSRVKKKDVARPGYSTFNVTASKRGTLRYKSATTLGKQLKGGQTIGRLFIGGKGKAKHLRPGVYSATGIGGSSIKPILIFVRQPNYSRRLPFHAWVMGYVKEHFPAIFNKQIETIGTKASAIYPQGTKTSPLFPNAPIRNFPRL